MSISPHTKGSLARDPWPMSGSASGGRARSRARTRSSAASTSATARPWAGGVGARRSPWPPPRTYGSGRQPCSRTKPTACRRRPVKTMSPSASPPPATSTRGCSSRKWQWWPPLLTNGLEVHRNNNSPNFEPQDGNGNIDPESAVVPDDEPANVPTILFPANLALALWIMALLTLSMVIGTVLYKPPRGGVFGKNKSAYYLTLATIFMLGVAEAFTAYCVSRSRDPNKRRFSFGRVILCASVGPFVAIVGISGFAFIEG